MTPASKKPKPRVSDKERLDWLTRQTVPYPFGTWFDDKKDGYFWRAWGKGFFHSRKSPRAAIDAAILAERREGRRG